MKRLRAPQNPALSLSSVLSCPHEAGPKPVPTYGRRRVQTTLLVVLDCLYFGGEGWGEGENQRIRPRKLPLSPTCADETSGPSRLQERRPMCRVCLVGQK